MLVLCGDTYMRRLWCMVELFVFLEMGAQSEHIDMYILAKGVGQKLRIQEGLAKFDIRESQCYLESDKEKLLGIIEVGFSTLNEFNTSIREMLQRASTQQDGRDAARLTGTRFSRMSRRRFTSKKGSSSTKKLDGDAMGAETLAKLDEVVGALTCEIQNTSDRVQSSVKLGQNDMQKRMQLLESKLDAVLGLLQQHLPGGLPSVTLPGEGKDKTA